MFVNPFLPVLPAMNFSAAIAHIQSHLRDGLSAHLTYHNYGHTEDVVRSAMRLADLEGVTEERELACLRLACWMHDTGFLKSHHDHERHSCQFVEEWLPEFGVDAALIRDTKQLIMATQLHSPATTLLERIIQDADLDYLGRADYELISNGLRTELEHRGQQFNDDDWRAFQVHFLSTHSYNTRSARELRQAGKEAHLLALKSCL